MVIKTPHEWSVDALLSKAQRFAEKMLEQPRDNWEFGFWSSLCLEMLVRAAVSKASPAFLADGKDWTNLAFALEQQSSGNKQSPKSIDISEAATRANALYPKFTREMVSFCTLHFQRRNAELHSGKLSFDALGTAWLPQFYAACEPLTLAAGSSLPDIFGSDEADTAHVMIQAHQDEASKAVNQAIQAHRTVWGNKSEEERQRLVYQVSTWATKAAGHRVQCPSCNCVALLQGTSAGPSKTKIEDDVIVIRTPMLPAHFECKACELKVSGFSKLNACGLGGTYTSTTFEDPVDYFNVEPEVVYAEYEMDDDNNEP